MGNGLLKMIGLDAVSDPLYAQEINLTQLLR